MDWVRQYGKGRVYTTMLGHTWNNELNPNLDDVNFQALLARGTEWAATGTVTLAVRPCRKPCSMARTWMDGRCVGRAFGASLDDGVLLGAASSSERRRSPESLALLGPSTPEEYAGAWFTGKSWLYTTQEFTDFDLHVEYWIPPGGNSGVSIRDRSRAHTVVGEPDGERSGSFGRVPENDAGAYWL